MYQLFYRFYKWVNRHRSLSIGLALISLLVGFFIISSLKIEDDITKILPKSEQGNITTKVFQQQNFSDKITVLVQKKNGGNDEQLIDAAEAIELELEKYKNSIISIQGVQNEEILEDAFTMVYNHLPNFLSDDDYTIIEQKINQDSIRALTQTNYERLTSPAGIISRNFILKDPLGLTFLGMKKLQEMSSMSDLLYQDGYLFTQDKSTLLLFINPKHKSGDTQNNAAFVEGIKEIESKINKEFTHINVQFFGAPIIAVANAKQIKSDIIKTIAISMSFLVVLLMFFYRKISIPLILFIPTVFGFTTALVIIYFIRKEVSAISISIGAVLLGITIDYALHMMTHFREKQSVEILYKEITQPILMSCLTTATAFICLVFLHSDALIDLGIFAFITVLMSGIFTLLFIPHLYRPRLAKSEEKTTFIDRFASLSFDQNKPLIFVTLVLVIVSLFTFSSVKFNQDLSSLNYTPEDQLKAEKTLSQKTSMMQSSLYLVNYGSSLEEVLEESEKVFFRLQKDLKNSKIEDFSSISPLLLPKNKQQEKIEKWNSFWTEERKLQLKKMLINEGEKVGFLPETYSEFYTHLSNRFSLLTPKTIRDFDTTFFDQFITSKDSFYTVSTLVKVHPKQKQFFIQDYHTAEKNVLIDRKQLSETYLGAMVSDFNRLINYSSIAIIIILWIFFRRVELVLVSLLPIIVTALVTAGLMGLFKIEFNIFSSIVCTLIFGHGVDFSIFMTSALQRQYTTGINETKSYKISILLAVTTTLLAIGSLIFAQHPALKSIASIAIIGVSVAALVTFVLYPPVFRFLFFNRPRKGLSPVSLRIVITTFYLFFYFIFFGIILNGIIRILRIIVPISRQKKYQLFDWLLTNFMKTIPYLNPFVKKKIINHSAKNHQQTVFISNHSSSLDIPLNKMLLKHSIFVVNDWVYRSPIFGKAIQSAGFFPISKGIESNLEKLKNRIGNEFSVIIYPEGTRSPNNALGRFHKGAFYLANELELPIQPLYLLGVSDVWPKNEWFIFDGQLTCVFGKVIQPNDQNYGTSYSEQAKKISRHFKEEYQKLRDYYEDENYFRKKLFLSFLYKENEVVHEMKINFDQKKTVYHELNVLLNKTGKIYRYANDFGEFDFILTMQQPKREMLTYIESKEKRAIAQTNYITKTREILYLTNETIPEDCTIMIVDAQKFTIEIPTSIKEIFVVDTSLSVEHFTDFVIKYPTDNFMHLKRL